MEVRIVSDDRFYLDLLVGGRSYFSATSIEEKGRLLEKANRRLEQDVSEIAESARDESLGAFLWCYTYDIHRDDGIKGTVLDYYLIEILRDLSRTSTIERIVLKYRLEPWVASYIQDNICANTRSEVDLRSRFSRNFRNSFGPIKYFIKYFFGALDKRRPIFVPSSSNWVLIFTDAALRSQRLFRFEGIFQENSRKLILDISLTKIIDPETREAYSTGAYGVATVARAILSTVRLLREKRDVLKKVDARKNLFANYVEHQSLLQSLLVLIRWEAFRNLFKTYNPKRLIVSSAFGDPLKRMPLGAAKVHGIPTTLFACRPFLSYLRSEDRVIEPDILEYNDTTVGDALVVLDIQSRDHLLASGIANERVSINDIEAENSDQVMLAGKGVLVLFAHERFNSDVIESLSEYCHAGTEIPRLYYREHPVVKLCEKSRRKINSLSPNVKCITEYSWNDLQFRDVVAITANSTSAVDAFRKGADVAWCPYFTEHSTQFLPMMQSLGNVCRNDRELFELLTDFFEGG